MLGAMCSVTNMSCFVAHACAVRFLSNHTSSSRWLCEADEDASSVTCNAKGLSLLIKAVCKYQITAWSLTFASTSGNLDLDHTTGQSFLASSRCINTAGFVIDWAHATE